MQTSYRCATSGTRVAASSAQRGRADKPGSRPHSGGPLMADNIKDTLKNAGEKFAEKAGQAKDWVEDKTGLGCGTAKGEIKPHMSVISSCGCTVGKVDHLEGSAIKLTRADSPDGQHHF